MSATATHPKQTTDRALTAYRQSGNYLVEPASDHPTAWSVLSLTGGSDYVADPVAGTCTCPDHQRRGVVCKHLHLVRFHVQEQAEQAAAVRVRAARDRALLWAD